MISYSLQYSRLSWFFDCTLNICILILLFVLCHQSNSSLAMASKWTNVYCPYALTHKMKDDPDLIQAYWMQVSVRKFQVVQYLIWAFSAQAGPDI